MGAEPGPFQAFYDGPLQHPWLLWAAAVAGLCVCLARREAPAGTRAYGVALALLSGVDAWLTANRVYGVGAFDGALATAVPLFFVLAGDLRFLIVVTMARRDGSLRPTFRACAEAALLVVVVPIGSQLVVRALPDAGTGGRTLFLVYELSFALLAFALLRLHPNARAAPWARSVARFVIAYYLAWAAADVWILVAGDLGYGLRVVPNVLYYGGFVAAVGWCAADAARTARASTD